MTQELLISEPDPNGWISLEKTGGIRVYKFWENESTGASISLLEIPAGAGVPVRHVHASNQFMFCIEGEYEYIEPKLVLKPGSFYSNPKGHPHGPTRALKQCLLLEIYDGPHYFDVPPYHTKETVGKIAEKL